MSRPPWRQVVLMVGALGAVLLLGRALAGYVPRFTEWVRGLGGWGPVAFIIGYMLASVAFVPGTILTLAAGAIWGLVRGTAYVMAGATLGAAAAFLIARYAARDWVERRLRGNPKFAAVDRAVAHDARKVVFLLRLSPAIPFNLLNYALGLTRVRFADALIASVGMLPGTLLYVYYGKIAGDLAALGRAAGAARGAGYYAVLGLGLAATIAVSVLVARRARRALHHLGEEMADVGS